ncbi:helix-turn-helix domain-containing protein [Planococcus plakortidis]
MVCKEFYPLKLKEERQRRKWTQQAVSEKIGISRSYYSDIENGRTLPSSKTLFEINRVLPIFLFINDADRVRGIAEEVQE